MTTHYCDNYEELTGKSRDAAEEPAVIAAVETKVVEAPEPKHAEINEA